MTCYCPKCNAQNPDTARFCSACGGPIAVPGVAPASQGFAPAPAGSSGKAVASLILGILGFLTFGLLGIMAVILGLMAKTDIRRSAGRLGGEGLAIAGIVMGTVSLAVAMLLVAIAVYGFAPGFVEARGKAQANACMEAQIKMDDAVDKWARETGKKEGAQPTEADLVGPDRYLRVRPCCPVSVTWIAIPPVGGDAVCPNAVPSHNRR